jgi:hypothetical protein
MLVTCGRDGKHLMRFDHLIWALIILSQTNNVSQLVTSLNRRRGNAIGVYIMTTDLEPKRLGLLRELLRGIRLMAYG